MLLGIAGDEGLVWALLAGVVCWGGGVGWDLHDWTFWCSGSGGCWEGGGADWVLGGWDGLPEGGVEVGWRL